MVKIDPKSHRLIHNTKVILFLFDSERMCMFFVGLLGVFCYGCCCTLVELILYLDYGT